MGTPPDDEDDEGWDDGTAVAGPAYIDAIAKRPDDPDFESESGTAVAGVDYVENILKTVEPAPIATAATIPRAATGPVQPRSPTMAFGTPALLRAPAGSPTPAPETPVVKPGAPDPTKQTLPLGSPSLGAIPPIRVPAKLPGMTPAKPAAASDSKPTAVAKPLQGPTPPGRASSPAIARESSPAIAREKTPAPAAIPPRASSPALAPAATLDKPPAAAEPAPSPAPAADVDVDIDMDAPPTIVAASAAMVPAAPVVPAYEDDGEEDDSADDLEAFDNAPTMGPGPVEMPALARPSTPAPLRPTPLPMRVPTPLPQQVPTAPEYARAPTPAPDYARAPTPAPGHDLGAPSAHAQAASGMHGSPAGYIPTPVPGTPSPLNLPTPAGGFAAPSYPQASAYPQINGQYPLAAGTPYAPVDAAVAPSVRSSRRPLVLIGAVLASVALGIGVYFVALQGRGGAKKPAAGATAGDAERGADKPDLPVKPDTAGTAESTEQGADKPDSKPEAVEAAPKPAVEPKPAVAPKPEPKPAVAPKPEPKPAVAPKPEPRPAATKPAPKPAPKKPAPKKPAPKKTSCSGLDCL
jgi:hypothetical protein